MTQGSVYAGIDVAKDRLDMAVRPSGAACTVAYDGAGVDDLVSRLHSLEPSVVVLEATGGLELPLAGALAAASLPVVVVNPRQVRDFARATGRMAKTDALDAQVLAHFAEAVRPEIRPLADSDTPGTPFPDGAAHSGGGNAGGGEKPAGARQPGGGSSHPGPYPVAGAGVG